MHPLNLTTQHIFSQPVKLLAAGIHGLVDPAELAPHHIEWLLGNYDPNCANYVYNPRESEKGIHQKSSDHVADANGTSEICTWRPVINSEH